MMMSGELRSMNADARSTSEFEARNRVRLPEEYREFLLRPASDTGPLNFSPEAGDTRDDSYIIKRFLLLGDGHDESKDLQSFAERFRDRGRIPKTTIPIAIDPFGNLFLL